MHVIVHALEAYSRYVHEHAHEHGHAHEPEDAHGHAHAPERGHSHPGDAPGQHGEHAIEHLVIALLPVAPVTLPPPPVPAIAPAPPVCREGLPRLAPRTTRYIRGPPELRTV